MLFDREKLLSLLKEADSQLTTVNDLLLVGGSAVLVLCSDSLATRDLDVFPTNGLEIVFDAVNQASQRLRTPVDINTASSAFETYLPEEWEDRLILSPYFSTPHIRVITPAPEDLAVMKVYRFNAKDAQDIQRLSKLESFSAPVFKKRFVETLPVSIGDKRWHAQSFSIIWSRLYPESPIALNEVLTQAGITEPEGA